MVSCSQSVSRAFATASVHYSRLTSHHDTPPTDNATDDMRRETTQRDVTPRCTAPHHTTPHHTTHTLPHLHVKAPRATPSHLISPRPAPGSSCRHRGTGRAIHDEIDWSDRKAGAADCNHGRRGWSGNRLLSVYPFWISFRA